jgi:hypothetical protein
MTRTKQAISAVHTKAELPEPDQIGTGVVFDVRGVTSYSKSNGDDDIGYSYLDLAGYNTMIRPA